MAIPSVVRISGQAALALYRAAAFYQGNATCTAATYDEMLRAQAELNDGYREAEAREAAPLSWRARTGRQLQGLAIVVLMLLVAILASLCWRR